MEEKVVTVLQEAVRKCRANILIAIFFSFFINILMFVAPMHMLQVYDRVLVSRSETTLVVLTGLAVGLLVIFGILDGVRSRILLRTSLKFDEIISDSVFRAIFQGTIRRPQTKNNYFQSLRDMDQIREFISGGPIVALCDAPWGPLFIAVIYVIHPLLGLVSTIGAIIIFIIAVMNELLTRDPVQQAANHHIHALTSANASLKNAEVVHALGMVSAVKSQWSKSHDSALSFVAQAGLRASSIISSSRFVRMALQVLILGSGAYLAIKDEITPGMMIAASIIMGRALAPVEMAVSHWRNIVASRVAYQRLKKIFEHHQDNKERMNLPPPTGEVSAEGVVIIPPGGRRPVLTNATIKLEPGTVWGLIGPSGSGKSSLARALVGVWPVVAGTLKYDGADISLWNPEDLGPYIGYMPQDVELFDGTVAENISRFQSIDSEAVLVAAKKAGVHQMVLDLPDGYDTEIGSAGQVLSGGQRQRIALARAMYGEPRVLVLDEPNSNLYTEGDRALVQAIVEAKNRGCTVLVISHKTALLANVDNIAVLNNGTIASSGTRDQILQQFVQPPRPGITEGSAATH